MYFPAFFVIFMATVSVAFGSPVHFPSDKSNSISMPSDLVKWVNASTSEVITKSPVPAGYELGVTLFVCRAKVIDETNYRPGKLWSGIGVVNCEISANGGTQRTKEFELLEAPPGSTSWVPFTGSFPSNAIDGGVSENGSTLYVCRGWTSDNYLLPGQISQTTCDVQRGNREEQLTTELEILVFNGYGKALEQNLAHSNT